MTNAPAPKNDDTVITLPADAVKDVKKDEAGKSAPACNDKH